MSIAQSIKERLFPTVYMIAVWSLTTLFVAGLAILIITIRRMK